MAPNYAHSLAALEHARGFRVVTTPADYFRILSPAGQLLLAASVVLSWRAPARKARWLLLIALVAAVATDVVTFTFHYPRNKILFVAALDRPWGELSGLRRSGPGAITCALGCWSWQWSQHLAQIGSCGGLGPTTDFEHYSCVSGALGSVATFFALVSRISSINASRFSTLPVATGATCPPRIFAAAQARTSSSGGHSSRDSMWSQ